MPNDKQLWDKKAQVSTHKKQSLYRIVTQCGSFRYMLNSFNCVAVLVSSIVISLFFKVAYLLFATF